MNKNDLISQDIIKELFEYKDETLYWKIKPSKRVNINSKAGHLERDGYIIA